MPAASHILIVQSKFMEIEVLPSRASMSELGGDSGRSALQRVIAKINDSRRDARILSSPEGLNLFDPPKTKFSTGLWNLLSLFNRVDENWFSVKANTQYSMFDSPYGVTLIVSQACENTARTTWIIAFQSFQILEHTRPQFVLVCSLADLLREPFGSLIQKPDARQTQRSGSPPPPSDRP